MTPIDRAAGRRLYTAIEAVVTGEDLTLEEVARRVGCTPHDVLDVLLQFNRASRVTVTPGNDCDDRVLLAHSSG